MFRSVLSMAFLITIWFMWAMMGSTPCARIERGASPVRAVFEGVHWVLAPWASTENNLWLITWGLRADQFTRFVFAHQFYGKTLTDVCPRIYPNVPALPSPATAPAVPASGAR